MSTNERQRQIKKIDNAVIVVRSGVITMSDYSKSDDMVNH